MSTRITRSTLEISGYQSNQIDNELLQQERETDHLAIILPGFSYSPDLPALYYPSLVALAHGADVLRVRYAYDRDPSFRTTTSEERSARISADVGAAIAAGRAVRQYRRMTLIGKSLGTMAMAQQLKNNQELHNATCIWLTPLLRDERLLAAITRAQPRSLFVIGTADEQYDAELLNEVVTATNGEQIVIDGANHGLEIVNDLMASLDAVKRIVEAIDNFL